MWGGGGGGGVGKQGHQKHTFFWPYLPYSIFLAQPLLNKNDRKTLQRDLNRLQAWDSKWDMEFNPSKRLVIRVTTARNPLDTQYSTYCMVRSWRWSAVPGTWGGGVDISSNLSWNTPVDSRGVEIVKFSTCPGTSKWP